MNLKGSGAITEAQLNSSVDPCLIMDVTIGHVFDSQFQTKHITGSFCPIPSATNMQGVSVSAWLLPYLLLDNSAQILFNFFGISPTIKQRTRLDLLLIRQQMMLCLNLLPHLLNRETITDTFATTKIIFDCWHVFSKLSQLESSDGRSIRPLPQNITDGWKLLVVTIGYQCYPLTTWLHRIKVHSKIHPSLSVCSNNSTKAHQHHLLICPSVQLILFPFLNFETAEMFLNNNPNLSTSFFDRTQ